MATPQPRDRDILLACGAAVVLGLGLIVIGAIIEGHRLTIRLVRNR